MTHRLEFINALALNAREKFRISSNYSPLFFIIKQGKTIIGCKTGF